MDPNFMYIGNGRDALVLFVSYLFDTWTFRYVYAEVPEYLVDFFYDSQGLRAALPFEQVGRYPDYLFHKGKFHAMVVFALSREQFDLARPSGL
jgi:hypothetical protein